MPSVTPHQQRALNYQKHISLTANAGSGKTFVLTRRFMDIILHEQVALQQIAAITFTKLAASELYNEIAVQIEKKLSDADTPAGRAKLEDIRKQLVSAHICTIHSFCADLLREFPVEAEIDPGFSPLDEYSESTLIAESISFVSRQEVNRPVEKRLSRIFGGSERLKNIFISLIRNRENFLVQPVLSSGISAEEAGRLLIRQFERIVEEFFTSVEPRFMQAVESVHNIAADEKLSGYKAVDDIVRQLQQPGNSTYKKAELAIAYCQAAMTKTTVGFLAKKYISKDAQAGLEKELTEICRFRDFCFIIGEAYNADGSINTGTFTRTVTVRGELITMLFEILELYTQRKKQKSALDFTDMLLLTRGILKLEHVRRALAGRFKYIMVDEYQDTNTLQYEIFKPLLNDLQQGNLFVVGDEKQSIYMFRNADIEVFARTREDIRKATPEGEVLSLPDSFRMSPGLCLFINEIFRHLFANPVHLFNEVAFEETICAKDTEEPGSVSFILSNSEDENSIPEAELVIAKILELKKERPQLRWSDMVILSRTKSVFEIYRPLLSRYKIPFSIIGGKGFFQAQCVLDVLNYLQFLISSSNDAALAGILRSPFFMVSDNDLFSMRVNGSGNLFERLQQYARSKPAGSRFEQCVATLNAHILAAKTSSISEILYRLYTDTPYLAIIARRENAGQIFANIRKLRFHARQFELEGFRILYDFVEYLKSASVELENEAYALVNSSEDSLRLMSIHASKGLQFPIVFLADMNHSTKSKGQFGTSLITDKNFGIVFPLPGSADYFEERVKPPVYGLAEAIQSEMEYAEEKRLLYVALTRAREELFLCATLKKAGTATANSYLEMIISSLGISVSAGNAAIEGYVKRLRPDGDLYVSSSEHRKIVMPVITQCEIEAEVCIEDSGTAIAREYDITPLPRTGREYIISASQFAAYSQCPLKYHLLYNVRMHALLNKLDAWEDYENQSPEGPSTFVTPEPVLRGQILHKLLEEECTVSGIDDRVEQIVQLHQGLDAATRAALKADIKKLYTAFTESDFYRNTVSYPEYKTEYAVLLQEDQFSLFGIVDRLITGQDKIIIVDYKSDRAPIDSSAKKYEGYEKQLAFYAYLVSRLQGMNKPIETWLAFISAPEHSRRFHYTTEDISTVQLELHDMFQHIQDSNPKKRTEHCPYCIFAERGRPCNYR
ncbi:MAG: UvrD-helicase domain-containing protein [Ignavibacteria bacterium]|nr:UvrD-helicase domain-containing protein [Ignavibacteria bacterium]